MSMHAQLSLLRCTCGTILAAGINPVDAATIAHEKETRVCPTCALKAEFEKRLGLLQNELRRKTIAF